MNKPALVSVLIPCHNAERWIGETLDSVYAQTYRHLEVIVVDDGSTDASAEIARRYVSRGLKLVRQANAGQTAALNRALREATGDYIQYLDADDLLGPSKIELQVSQLEGLNNCISTAEWARFHASPAEAEFTERDNWCDLPPVDWLVTNWADGGGMMYPALWLLPRSIVRAAGPWREDLTLVNDTEYFARAVLASQRVLFCRGARTFYRSGQPGRLSARKSHGAWQSYFRVLDFCEQLLRAREDSDRTRRVCSMMWQRLAHGCYPYRPLLAEKAMARASSLHAARLPVEGGPMFQRAARVIGWRPARMVQRMMGRA